MVVVVSLFFDSSHFSVLIILLLVQYLLSLSKAVLHKHHNAQVQGLFQCFLFSLSLDLSQMSRSRYKMVL
jgi:competence protein ComGF